MRKISILKPFNNDMLPELITSAVCLVDNKAEFLIFKHYNMLYSRNLDSRQALLQLNRAFASPLNCALVHAILKYYLKDDYKCSIYIINESVQLLIWDVPIV